ncbi:MAG: phosphomannomutase/phosphoglucomutase, partial [Alphaproteobacteria bacterium]|nr:phosphomannomutase/phosphoglucomutase [Alphaproteobacteria bacterium]
MTEKHVFHSSILREYDIRGVVDKTLTASDSLAIGRAFGTMVVEKGGKSVCVGYDGRLSSFAFEAEVVKGLKSCGLNVKCIGMGPTPMLYFASKDADAGIMITGSHNPPDQNGFKMVIGGKPFFGDDIRRLGEIALSGNYASGEGSKIEFHVENQYIERLLQDYSSKKELKVVWDAGNGATGDILTALTKRLSGKHTLLFAEVDGTFPNHHPDPADPENLDNLQSMVATEKADIGIAFDGDGDRLGVVDSSSKIIWPDRQMMLFSKDVLSRHPGADIIFDVKCSRHLQKMIKQHNGRPIMWR